MIAAQAVTNVCIAAAEVCVFADEVVIHPVALKYLCIDRFDDWAERQLDAFEQQLGWKFVPERSIRVRTVRLAEALLALKEIQYYGKSSSGALPDRRDALIEYLLDQTMANWR